jgi:hypothetical protein
VRSSFFPVYWDIKTVFSFRSSGFEAKKGIAEGECISLPPLSPDTKPKKERAVGFEPTNVSLEGHPLKRPSPILTYRKNPFVLLRA